MATYTTQVRSICEVKAGREERAGFSEVEEILSEAWDKIFTNDWTTFDEDYKSVLCCKILRHYYTREICAETVGLWMLWLNSRMCEIMPYYNDLYKTASLDFNPLFDTDIITERTGGDTRIEKGETKDGRSTTRTDDLTAKRTDDLQAKRIDNLHQDDEDSHYNLYNDTPQGGLGDIDDLSYLTDARKIYGENHRDNTGDQTVKNTGDQTTKNTGTQTVVNGGKLENDLTITTTVGYVDRVTGKRGGQTYSKMIAEYRETLINIDNMIIKELKDLFFNIY